MTQKIDLVGRTFGYLLVLREAGRTKKGGVIWECSCGCGCGTVVHKASMYLLSGETKSCGKLRAIKASEVHREHGDSYNKNSPYISWMAMKARCLNSNHPEYMCYGGRGISICPEWADYSTYREWALANGWKKGLTIDRIDNDKGYEPLNCRFITRSENSKKSNTERLK